MAERNLAQSAFWSSDRWIELERRVQGGVKRGLKESECLAVTLMIMAQGIWSRTSREGFGESDSDGERDVHPRPRRLSAHGISCFSSSSCSSSAHSHCNR